MQLACQSEEAALNSKREMSNECTALKRDKGKLEIQCRQLKADLAGTDRSAPASQRSSTYDRNNQDYYFSMRFKLDHDVTIRAYFYKLLSSG